jgi:hypothetical protein
MSIVKIQGNASGTGTLTIAAPNTNSDRTLTLPDNAGTLLSSASALSATNLSGRVPSANAPLGSVIQVVSTTKTDVFSSTSTSYTDITGLSASITPTNSANKILVFVSMTVGSAPLNVLMMFRLLRGATAINVGDVRSGYVQSTIGGARGIYDTNGANTLPMLFLDSPATTSSTTYKVQGSAESGTFKVNANGSDASGSVWSFTAASTITLMEIAA